MVSTDRRVVSAQPPRRKPGRPAGKPRSATAIRFPIELHEALAEAAFDRDVSINYLVCKAVEDFLPRLIPIDEFRLTR